LRADTIPELLDPGHAMTILDFVEAGFGPRLVSVTAPDGVIAPTSTLHEQNRGKAPGRLTSSGWTSFDINKPKLRCHDHATARTWASWGANAGFVAGDGYVIPDNDEGEALDEIIARVCLKVLGPIALLRRFVRSPGHRRSAFLFRVLDFVGDAAVVGNQTVKFDRRGVKAELALRRYLARAGGFRTPATATC
jgi:hypothetical protein